MTEGGIQQTDPVMTVGTPSGSKDVQSQAPQLHNL